MSRSAAAGSRAAGTHPGMHLEGVLAVVCLDNPRDNTRGKALWTALPSPGPQEECPWRLSDVIPARMVSHTLTTIMIHPENRVAHARWKRLIGQAVYHASKGPTVGSAKGKGRGQQPSWKLEGEKHG
jgi:hypothetical protein